MNPPDEKDRRRSERVILRVPVIVSAKMLDGKVVHYEPHTLVVNAHGGLLAVGIEIPVGQRFVLSNPKTQKGGAMRGRPSGEIGTRTFRSGLGV